MTSKNPEKESVNSESDLFFKVLSGAAVEAQCKTCQAVEWVIPLDSPLDDFFLANYFCDECDE